MSLSSASSWSWSISSEVDVVELFDEGGVRGDQTGKAAVVDALHVAFFIGEVLDVVAQFFEDFYDAAEMTQNSADEFVCSTHQVEERFMLLVDERICGIGK